jgi:excisionase family DNA binding protein
VSGTVTTVAEQISISEAARILGVHAGLVRRHARAGRIPAQKIGNSWVINRSDLPRAEATRRGRPLSARSVWAIVRALSDLDVEGLSRSEHQRLRGRIREIDRLDASSWRARVVDHWYFGHPGILQQLAADPRVRVSRPERIRSGHRLVSLGPNPLYVSAEHLADLSRRFALKPAAPSDANLHIRVPVQANWLFSRPELPDAAIALDLLEARDARSGDSARRALRRLADKHLAQQPAGR